MKIGHSFLVSTWLILLMVSIISPIVTSGYTIMNKHLEVMGIEGPFTNTLEGASKVIEVNSEISLSIKNGYVYLDLSDSNGRISIPGHPALPFKSYTIVLQGKYQVNEVSLMVLRYHEEPIEGRIIAAIEPIPYMFTKREIKVDFNEEIYSSDKYYPGKLLDYYVGYGLGGKTVIIIYYFPIQYNPVRNELVVVDRAYIVVKYQLLKSTNEPKNSIAIITSSELAEVVEPLVDFYNETGFNVNVYTVEEIYANYTPAENITLYPGFYKPYAVEKDPIYSTLQRTYNWTLALKIISFLRNVTGKYKYLLLIGDGNTVPPSFYYQVRYYVDPWNSWNPTDFFYASPDYDLIPDYYVGRIPFSDSKIVAHVVEKIIDWYKVKDKGRNIALSGGAPFSLPLLFGESALSTATLKGFTSMFNVTLLTLTSLNYNRENVLSILQNGGYLWYYAICHGNGIAFVDLILGPEERPKYMTLVSVKDLMAMKEQPMIPVVSSVACMNAAWDDEILPPWYFKPPCFGEAILLSPAGGIAYIGSARVAFELGIVFNMDKGLVTVESYGASFLHLEILRAYNDLMSKKDSVGLAELVAQGITYYLRDVYATGGKIAFGYTDLILLTIFQLTLLGDPALQLPVFEKEFIKTKITDIEPVKPDALINVKSLTYADWYKGTVPFFKPMEKSLIMILGSDGEIEVEVSRIFPGYSWWYLQKLKPKIVVLKGKIEKGVYNLTIVFNKTVSGLTLIKVRVPGRCEVRFHSISFGLLVRTREALAGGPVLIEGYGLDIALGGYYTADLMVAGRIITKVKIDPEGYFNWTLALPYLTPGIHSMALLPPEHIYERLPKELIEMLKGPIKVIDYKEIKVLISIGSLYEPGSTVKSRIITMIDGKPVSVKSLSLILLTPTKKVELQPKQVDIGEYELEFKAPDTPGTYIIIAVTSHEDNFIKAFGSSVASFVVTTRFYDLQRIMVLGLEKLSSMINMSSSNVMESITNLNESLSNLVSAGFIKITKFIEDTSGEIIAVVKVFNETVYTRLADLNTKIIKLSENTVKIITELGTITGTIEEIKDGVAVIKTNLGELRVSIDEIETTVKDVPKLQEETINKLNNLTISLEHVSKKAENALKEIGELKQVTTIITGLIILVAVMVGAIGAATIRKLSIQKG